MDPATEAVMSPIEFGRRRWLYLAPTWAMPLLLMGVQVTEDILGDRTPSPVWMMVIVMSWLTVSTFVANRAKTGAVSWGIFYSVWLIPMMTLWCGLVLLRGVVFTFMGRPM